MRRHFGKCRFADISSLTERIAPSVTFSSRAPRDTLGACQFPVTKRARKMVTIHNLNEMKAAVQENDSQTKLLVLGLGEAILTTCGMARVFLGNNPSFGDEPKSTS